MMSRRQQYLDTYARAAASIERQKQIRADIAEEQQQVRYLDSLLASERQTLAAIEQNFRVAPPQSLDQAVSLLKEQYSSEDAKKKREASDALARKKGLKLTKEETATFTVTDRNRPDAILTAAEKLIANPKTSPEKATAAFAFVIDQVGKDAPGIKNLASVLGQKGVAPESRKAAPVVRKLTPKEEARQQATDEAFRTAFFAGPSGIVGGYDGMAVADARKTTVAPENTSFNTAEDAYNAAISAMGDGALSADEFSTADDFAYAKSIYAEAQATKAYRNDERIHFEPSVLEARLRLRELQQRRESSAGAAYKDSAREAQRRELMARGITLYDEDSKDAWRNQYAQYQGTPYYDVYIQAHEAVDRWQEEGGTKRLLPVTKAQQNAVQYANMLDAAKKPYSPETIINELTKVGYSDSEAAEATSFLMAYREIGGPKQGKSTYDALKAAEAKATAEAERRKAIAEEAEAEYQKGVERVKKEEQAMFQQAGRTGAPYQLGAAPKDLATEYARLRASGLTEQEARDALDSQARKRREADAARREQERAGRPMFPAVSDELQGEQPFDRPRGPTFEEDVTLEEDITFGEGSGAIPTESFAAPATPEPVGFKDPTDPNSPTYFRADNFYTFTDKAGKEVRVPQASKAGAALAMAEKGDVEAIRRLQAVQAAKRKAGGEKAPAGKAPAGKAPVVEEFEVEVDPLTGKLRRKPKGG